MKWYWSALLISSLLLPGCRGSSGGILPMYAVSLDVPAQLRAGQQSQWRLFIIGGQEPHTVRIDFADGAAEATINLSVRNKQLPLSIPVTPRPGDWRAEVTVTDAAGQVTSASTMFSANAAPQASLESMVFNHIARRLEFAVTVSDPEEDSVTVSLVLPAGWTSDNPVQTIASGATGGLLFRLSQSGEASGDGPLSLSLLMDDGHGEVSQQFGALSESPLITIPPLRLPADSLYAVPLKSTARVGEAVPVQILTGLTAHPLLYVESVSLTVEEDGYPLMHSLDLGRPSSEPFAADGIWASLGVSDFLHGSSAVSGFPPMNWLGNGRRHWDFRVIPLNGRAERVEGAVAVLSFVFTTAGTKTFGLLEEWGVKRTYYSAGAEPHYWADISNSMIGIPNSVEILP